MMPYNRNPQFSGLGNRMRLQGLNAFDAGAPPEPGGKPFSVMEGGRFGLVSTLAPPENSRFSLTGLNELNPEGTKSWMTPGMWQMIGRMGMDMMNQRRQQPQFTPSPNIGVNPMLQSGLGNPYSGGGIYG